MKKVLFIDRDGTIIKEPKSNYQIDSLEKLEFMPRALSALRKIRLMTDFELVMVTNQDGLGTDSFPEKDFWPAHYKMLKTLEGEDIIFSDILIDRSFPEENKSTRKPGTGLLTDFINNPEYDLAGSYVIGDRESDMELAGNLGCSGIRIGEHEKGAVLATEDWDEIADFLIMPPRRIAHQRHTRETQIRLELNLDGKGRTDIHTGLGFFDHMLDQLGKHGGIDLMIDVEGDLHIDEHHTIEDVSITLGEAFLEVLGDKRGISRYGFLLPMDDALAQVAIDFGGRPWLNWSADFRREKIGDMPTEMFYHFFKSFADNARCNLDIQVSGENEHHKIEAIFKGFARAIEMAVKRDPQRLDQLPSTKGKL